MKLAWRHFELSDVELDKVSVKAGEDNFAGKLYGTRRFGGMCSNGSWRGES